MPSTFLEAAGAFADQVAALPADLVGPGLGEWGLRALVGHTSRSIVTVGAYLDLPADDVAVHTAAEYYLAIAPLLLDATAVTERGVAAGEALGADPAGAVRRLLDTVTAQLADASPDQLVTTIAGGMRLADYLPTRSLELVVHGLDIAAATGTGWQPPAAALAEAVHLATDVALLGGSGTRLLRLVTGRETGGFSIV